MKRGFRPGWKMTLFVLALLPTLLSLGAWQLRRGAEKQALYDQYQLRAGALPMALDPQESIDRQAWAFKRVRLQGDYQPGRYYLIDNQVRDGEVGYWVVQPLATADGRIWFINRGFVAAGPSRALLPEVATPEGPVELVAMVWPDTGLVPLLSDDAEQTGWPRRYQRLDVTALAAEHPRGQPVELRLEAGQISALAAAPTYFASGASRHQGYAVQWFGLAAVLLVGFVVFGLRTGASQGPSAKPASD